MNETLTYMKDIPRFLKLLNFVLGKGQYVTYHQYLRVIILYNMKGWAFDEELGKWYGYLLPHVFSSLG